MLQQPYPLWDNKLRKFYSSAGISIFVFLFLYVFKPFGLNHFEGAEDIVIFIGYGLVSFVLLILLQFVVPSLLPTVFTEERWMVYKEILFTLIIISCIGIGNMIYSAWLGLTSISSSAFVFFEMVTLMVAIIPVSLSVLIKQNYLLRTNLKQSRILSDKLYRKTRMPELAHAIVKFESENAKDTLSVESKDIYYVGAADNYIEVHIKQNDVVKQIVLRNTLKNAHDSLKRFSNFYRCHRTYIVNLDKIQSVTGNSQGYKLILFDTEKQIPVSRTLTRELTQRLKI